MRHWHVRSPVSEQEWHRYYQLRWQILRAPWNQPEGSERDELDAFAYHLMLVNPAGDIAAAGRLHQLDKTIAQVRYMAVAHEYQGKGAGSRILAALEAQAVAWGCANVSLNARDTAIAFYLRYGYHSVADAASLFGIPHVQMAKKIRLSTSAKQHQQWCEELSKTWQETIPLSVFMQLNIKEFDGNALRCQAPLAPNINLHQTMFAGSIYTLATLTGWGMLYLQLRALGLQGNQVLADGSIKYFKPVTAEPEACCVLQNCLGSLEALGDGRKVIQQIRVQIYSAGTLAAEFSGRYAVLPHKELTA
ncbi:bifunctional GNAT family N-acetyltransferase/hotdog fold thioesterase [Rheinheimera baltica]|uniref:bifunctional GNAT family N-acetyltransferase/hotdog fold thioesterase n=1 Tax=Rheinheimera baltica TaxID=67576 RepID=UPI00273D193D|nr:bifunctional GNAT family N-acetyltransferase/hotdog fold thioesterase [Rheinheimera baltica]MDP5151432.1 bifunctional GNAT family N-acetyltransferase/hotdog fold thioesterase [Rheinheimera baltica]